VPVVLKSACQGGLELGNLNVPADLAITIDIYCQLLARRNVFSVFFVPCKQWPVKQVVLGFVGIEHGKISGGERLLGWCNGGVVESKA
jgi:hypothetical protein